MLKDRILSARRLMERLEVEALLFLHLPNIRYLSGFTGSDGALLIRHDEGWFLTDSRYTTQAEREVFCSSTVTYRSKVEGIAECVQKAGSRRLGIEAEHMTVSFHDALSAALPGVELVAVGSELDELRLLKDAAEVELLDRSASIASEALIQVLDQLRPGSVERDVALALEILMKQKGAEDKAFDFIVASGVRGALPHGRASEKVIAAGELVTLDFGARFDGYHSDETVTVAIGKPDSRQREIYSIVKDAHDLALAGVKPGVALKELDSIARGHIESKGYGSCFGHGLGHGVGLEVHEKPTVSFRSDGVLKEGMVITVEPGIYIPEWGGVRIEDTVIVTADGYRVLSKVPKDLIVI
ncbi:Xaa-Pro peptidase family protein [Geobacter sp. DSM 9736]|uniref:M24 family metallopeptidase n=1 Tax=Geobacter sp. DSM 9736 TaxID=1277350 RepID=UPI000B5118D4|nr:Xaa-Pro peptidase family protein [Geobacter sp. DSM 9736]SNB46181.1 Xaa-Pro aminopeptidase [Geobacter sp. DSM 9736]